VIGLLALVVLAGGVVVMRTRVARRARRIVAARLTLGPDGIVVGASSIDLPAAERGGVLLLHGFGDTPQTLGYLAAHLHGQGWGVHAPLLPGHGRTLDAFAVSRTSEWLGEARDALVRMRSRYDSVAVVGLSMGGSLATILAAEFPDIQALVLLAPYLSMPTRLRRAASMHHALAALLPYLRGGGERSIRDPAELSRNLAYGFTTPRLVFELSRVVAQARAAAPRVTAPTLVVQSRQDNRIPPDAAERAFALFSTAERRLVWTEGNGHIITVDYGRQAIFAAVSDWLSAHVRVSGPPPNAAADDTSGPNAASVLERPRLS
jgi:carboxylesterase